MLLVATIVALLESLWLQSPSGCQAGIARRLNKFSQVAQQGGKRVSTGSQAWFCTNGSTTEHLLRAAAKGERFLTYQPPGNGWNNQRQALETALILAVMLNRTLIVHPMSPHSLSVRLKRLESLSGYQAYNAIAADKLTSVSTLLDLQHMADVSGVHIVEWCNTQHALKDGLAKLSWHEICHSGGRGYWLDHLPSQQELDSLTVLQRQSFEATGGWETKCRDEIAYHQKHIWNEPLVRLVSDLVGLDTDILYISEGTLFGVDLRFVDKDEALASQAMLLNSIRLESGIYKKARKVAARLSPYNAVHVRRGDHSMRYKSVEYWLKEMAAGEFIQQTKNLYVATDEERRSWFQPLADAGYNLTFASDIEDILNSKFLPEVSRQDVTGVYEQAVLLAAMHFVPSPHSTFSKFVTRSRNEMESWDGMLTDGIRIKWIGHTVLV